VHWGYRDEDWETVHETHDNSAREVRRLKIGAQLVPNGVAYDRLTVLLLRVVKNQHVWIEACKAKLGKSGLDEQ
jgi:hypothetical protein